MQLSCGQGFRLGGTNHKELFSVEILIVDLVQALVDLVQALNALVLAHVDLVQALIAVVQAFIDLVQALVALVQVHPPQGGLTCVVRRQVVVGPGSGLIGAVWWVFVRGVRWKQVCYIQVVHGLGVRWTESVISRPKG